MRISRKAKQENERKILATASNLFREKGYQETTIRDIAIEAGIATGTMFNYFSSKEGLAMTLVSEAFSKGREVYSNRRTGEEGFSEDLFLLISSELRQLKSYRHYIGPVLESGMSLFPRNESSSEGERIRERHLKLVLDVLVNHGKSVASKHLFINLYWPLYLGIIAFWLKDESVNQEDTIAFIDYSLHLFSRVFSGTEDHQGGFNVNYK